jgi:hypothetical protein
LAFWEFLCCPIISDALERLKNVFIYAQTFWALWKNPEAQKIVGHVENFIWADYKSRK